MSNPPHVDFSAVAGALGLKRRQVESTVALLDDANTVPFITRYRKEQTGNLDEEQIRAIQQEVHSRRQVAERAEAILRLIDAQGKLTDELRTAIQEADSLKRLEDLYLPYRPKRQSRATQAREKGLEPLANAIWDGSVAAADLEGAAAGSIDPERGVETAEDALQGAADILAERIGENADFRQISRETAWKSGKFSVSAAKAMEENPEGQEYRDYFAYSEAVQKIPPHRMLAVNRGEKAGVLKVKLEWDRAAAQTRIAAAMSLETHAAREFLTRCLEDAVDRLIAPSLEREIRREATEKAERHAVDVFARNLRNLLLQPPLRGKRILAIDPGFRTGCKVAAIDECGNSLATDVVYVTGSEDKRAANIDKLAGLIKEHGCEIVALGNGTACRETEELVSETIEKHCPELRYLIVNEAGASIYSTSAVAREEFPDCDATVRGTISIGRRVIDPLSELVKIDPQHLGVGLYQHDVTPRLLQDSLEAVIESCVNFVGVDLNTASVSLLRRVSGLNQLIARRILEWRKEHGRFADRQQLLDVAGIGDATFTQAAGFLKITNGNEPFDATWIHPESYDDARRLLEELAIPVAEVFAGNRLQEALAQVDRQALAEKLSVSELTLNDLLSALTRPGRDPRGQLPEPVFKHGILKLDDLEPGMELTGTVLNVVDFGAFVDIGLKDSGLVHISQLSAGYVKSPHDVLSVGDVVKVWVLSIDHERKRVALTMIAPGTAKPERRPRRRKKPAGQPAGAAADPPTRESGDAGSAATVRKRPKKRKRKRSTEVLPEVEEGQTLRGFDELKALWVQKRHKPK